LGIRTVADASSSLHNQDGSDSIHHRSRPKEDLVNQAAAVQAPVERGLYFDDFSIGQSWVSPARTITDADLVAFAGISGDFNPLHTDEEFAKATQFGGRIFHGPGVFAIATGLESRLGIKEGTAIAFLGMTWNLKGPVQIGDTIHVEEQVAEVRPSSSKPDRGIITFDVQVKNQHGTVCHDGQWFVMFSRRG
jgi:acyl dehydratase